MSATAAAVIGEAIETRGAGNVVRSSCLDTLCETMSEHFGNDATSVFTTVRNTFQCMDIAQEEMERAELLHGDQKEKIKDAFLDLMPGMFVGRPDQLYRSHCRELLGRVVSGADLCPGTRAEAMLAMHATSLLAPLNAQGSALYESLFTGIFGEPARARASGGRLWWDEPWPGASDELLSTISRRLARDRRA